MVAEVVAHVHLLDLAVFVLALDEHVLEEVVVVFLHLLVRHVRHEMTAVGRLGRVLRVHVQVLQQASLREGGLVVDARTPIPMPAGSDFEVERTVYLVLFGTENRGQILCHRFSSPPAGIKRYFRLEIHG
uniref:Putative secreted protein n=1 Tax=Anopheles triannulatus TaxID=58253 RepID=A0A2M4B2T8_9DIPT